MSAIRLVLIDGTAFLFNADGNLSDFSLALNAQLPQFVGSVMHFYLYSRRLHENSNGISYHRPISWKLGEMAQKSEYQRYVSRYYRSAQSSTDYIRSYCLYTWSYCYSKNRFRPPSHILAVRNTIAGRQRHRPIVAQKLRKFPIRRQSTTIRARNQRKCQHVREHLPRE